MGFLAELVRAIFLVGVPMAGFSVVIVWWALRRGYFNELSDTRALGKEIKMMSKNKGEQKLDPVQQKWVKFGGGFYGVAAFFTWTIIEVSDLIAMVMEFGGFLQFLKALGFNLVIEVIIEAIMNFVSAMIWPFYWLQRIDTGHTWLWFLTAYGGYWVGLKLAQVIHLRHTQQ